MERIIIMMTVPNLIDAKFIRAYEALRHTTKLNYELLILETHLSEEFNFAKAMNTVFNLEADYYVILSADVYVMPNWLESLIETSKEDSNIGIVSGLYYFPDGRIQHAGGRILSYEPDKHVQITISHRFYEMNIKDTKGEEQKQIDCIFVTSALTLITKACVDKIGVFDERLKIGWNDIEYCFRAWKIILE